VLGRINSCHVRSATPLPSTTSTWQLHHGDDYDERIRSGRLADSRLGTGVTPVVLSVPFTVVGAASLSLSLSRTTLSMAQNGSGVTSLSLTRTNKTNLPVTLSISALPAGVTATFADNPVLSNGTALNVVAGPATTPGSYPLTINATSTVGAAASVNMTLIVTGANTSGNMSIRFCGTAADIPIWLGFAPGNSWTRIPIGANNTFTFDFGSQGTVAWVTQRGADDFRINIVAGTLDEVAVIAASQCASPSNRTANGIASGLAVTDQAQIVFGPRSATTAPTFAAPNFSFTLLPDGALDLAATRSAVDIAAGALTVNKVILQRALNPASGGSIGTLDFNGASAIVPEQKTITAQGLVGGEQLLLSSAFRTAAGTSISLGSTADTASARRGGAKRRPAHPAGLRHHDIGRLLHRTHGHPDGVDARRHHTRVRRRAHRSQRDFGGLERESRAFLILHSLPVRLHAALHDRMDSTVGRHTTGSHDDGDGNDGGDHHRKPWRQRPAGVPQFR
jgi:hypothetical protein